MKIISIIDDNNKNKKNIINKLDKISKDLKFEIDILYLSSISSVKINILKKNLYDYLVCFGGDGTIIKSAKIAHLLKIKIVGVNIGHIGFLSSYDDIKHLDIMFKNIINKKYNIVNRYLYSFYIVQNDKITYKSLFLNDLILRNNNLCMMSKYEISLDKPNEYINNFHADGLIISSPTGSTAYNLSVGGPIVDINTKCFIISLINPHSFNNRSFIINDNRKIIISIINPTKVLPDGRDELYLSKNEKIYIYKSNSNVKFINFNDYNFFHILKKRINSI